MDFRSTLIISAFVIQACSFAEKPVSPLDHKTTEYENTLILMVFDGMRADYVRWYDTPNMDALVDDGLWATDGMLPVFPSKTFPNLYSIMTGLYPSNHGIIANHFYDVSQDDIFFMSDQNDIIDPKWWGGEPIWVTAEKQGLTTATYFSLGSEVPIKGLQPTYWFPFDRRVPNIKRLEQALTWLDLPSEKRPQFISLYFSDVDTAGHRFGPEAQETGAAVEQMDGLVGQLSAGLKERGLFETVNIMIVADHGMAQLSPDRVIALDEFVNVADIRFLQRNPLMGLSPEPGKLDSLYNSLKGAHPNLQVFLKEKFPERYHYSESERIPPIVGYADEGWAVNTERDWINAHPDAFTGGLHGYDNELPSMRATFIAHGPTFRKGSTIDPFINVQLYNLMAAILGIESAPNDGDTRFWSDLIQ